MKQTHREISAAVNAFLATYEADKVPKGFRTLEQWSPHFKVSDRQVHNIMQRLIRAKQAERATYRIKAGTMIRPVPHYRLSPLAEKALGTHRKFSR